MLVDHVKIIQDEIDDFNTDNAELRLNFRDLEAEIDKLRNQKQYFLKPFMLVYDESTSNNPLIPKSK